MKHGIKRPGIVKRIRSYFQGALGRKRLLIVGLMAIGVGVFFMSTTLYVAGNPRACIGCHSMKPNYEAWKISSHGKITCLACHKQSGNGLAFLYDDMRELDKTVIPTILDALGIKKYERPINAENHYGLDELESETCMRCHNMGYRRVTASSFLTITGKNMMRHVEMGFRCTTCHNRVAHWGLSQIEYDKGEHEGHKYKNFMDMRIGCRRCHSFKNPLTIKVKGKTVTAPNACTTCHPADWKLLPVGHKDSTWLKKHGPFAKAKGFRYCLKCHIKGAKFDGDNNKTLCLGCHPKSWNAKFEAAAPPKEEIIYPYYVKTE